MNQLINVISSVMSGGGGVPLMAIRKSSVNSDIGVPLDDVEHIPGSIYQGERISNRFLPYAKQLDQEADELLARIKSGIGKCAMLRDINDGCLDWCGAFNRYLRLYGLRFTKDEHIVFIKLLYELVTIKNLEVESMSNFAIILITLLKKKNLISPDELKLAWKPLYDLCQTRCISNTSEKKNYLSPIDLKRTLGNLVEVSKVYFPLEATQEILDELKPKLGPCVSGKNNIIIFLRWFLPVQLPPKHHNIGHQLWFHEFMQFWETYHYLKFYDNEMMHIMAKLASNNIGYIDWNPYIPIMFTRILDAMNLPVSYKKIKCKSSNNEDTSLKAEWIASILGDKSDAQIYLDTFIKTTETYFHPANFGPWSMKLQSLFTDIIDFVTKRFRRERYGDESWETPIPDNYKLSDANIDVFVTSMLPVALIAIFNPISRMNSYSAVQNLANLRPNLVIPKIIEKLYPLLDADTERHKLPSVLGCMSVIMRPLVQGSRFYDEAHAFPEGPTYVMPLLFAALSGLNPNEPMNSLAALNFIRTCALLIPIVDCSKSKLEKSEADQIICEETARFEDFVLQLMDCIFTLVKSGSQESIRIDNHANAVNKDAIESLAEHTLSQTFTFLLRQTSDEICLSMLKKLRTFVAKENLEIKIAGPMMATICQAFSRRSGELTLKALVPYLTDVILGYFKDHTIEEQPDNQLLYPLLILQSIMFTQYDALLPYLEIVQDVIDKVMLLKFCESQKIACNMLRNVLKTFCSVDRLWNFDHLNNPEYPHWEDWGKSIDRESIKVNLLESTEKKFVTVQSIFERFFIPSLTSIQNYVNGTNLLSRDELQKHLRIINSIIEGCDTVLPIWNEPPLLSQRHKLCTATFEPINGINFKITMPDGSNVRHFLVQLMAKLQEVMLKNVEDDTKSLLLVLQIWQVLEGGKYQKINYITAKRLFLHSIMESVKMDIKSDKEYLFLIFNVRVLYQHEWRLAGSIHPVTQTSKDIMLNLFQLSISQYSEIRKKAQDILTGIFEITSYSAEHIIPLLKEVLQRDTEVHHDAYKGVLYLLTRSDNFMKGDWRYLLDLLPAIVLAKPTEKLSAIHLQERFFIIEKFYSTMNITLDVSEQCVEAASKLWDCGIQPTESRPTEVDVKNGIEVLKTIGLENLQVYNAILDKLITIASERNLHWRHRQMAIQFVSTLAHPEYVPPPTVIRYFLNALNNDLIDERKMAWSMMPIFLFQLKRKHKKITIDVPSSVSPTIQGVRPDNQWLQYSSKNWPTNAKEWDEPRFVHKHYVGFYCWPKSLEVYAPSSEQPSLDRNSRQMSEQEREVDKFFADAHNVKKLIELHSLEGKKNTDHFNFQHCLMFEGLFRNHGDDHLDLFLPHLEALIRDERQCAQRCVAELLAGLIRGAKHWTFEKTESLWGKLLPLIRLALENANAETLENWAACISVAFKNRDPNRMHWLVECLVDATLRTRSGKSSINEKTHLRVFRAFSKRQFWRVSELLQGLLPEFMKYLYENPLMGVRDELAKMLAIIFYLLIVFQDEKMESLGYLKINELMQPDHKLLKNLFNEDSEDGQKFLHSLCFMIKRWLKVRYVLISSFYKLYPIIVKVENSNTQYPELAETCTQTLASLASTQWLPKHVSVALEAIKEGSQSESRSERISTVQFLEVIIFNNMNILMSNKNWMDDIQSMVLRLLQDENIEVREKYAKVLTGMIHCTLITDRKTLLDKFIKMAEKKKSSKKSSNSNQTICVQHAAILGMCAFIQAHPYDIPQDVPPLFKHLSSHIGDPHPIPTTIRQTLGDFKRTHCDTTAGVQGLAEQLTSEQFEFLQDLSIQPSYYT